MDEFTKLKTSQLEIAKASNVLLYYREKSLQLLGKKIKVEVGRVFLSSEIKDCMKVLTRINNDNESIPIDVAIIEYDTAALKLIDYINKRPASTETSNCPLIPIIVLVADSESRTDDVEQLLQASGGANKILSITSPPTDILLAVLDLLHNRKRVEDTFRKIKKVRVISSKYPYLPVFGDKAKLAKEMAKKKEHSSYDPNRSGDATSVSAADFKMDEVDDDSEVSHILPTYLEGASKRNTSPPSMKTIGMLKRRETARVGQDLRKPSKDVDDFKSINLDTHFKAPTVLHSENELIDDENDLLEHFNRVGLPNSLDSTASEDGNEFEIHAPLSLTTQSYDAQVDSFDNATNGTNQTHSTGSSIARPIMRSKALKLLSSSCRPWWSGSLTTSATGKQDGSNIRFEIHSFVSKPAPSMSRPSTVSGLDKRSMNKYWNQLQGNGNGNGNNNGASTTNNLRKSVEMRTSGTFKSSKLQDIAEDMQPSNSIDTDSLSPLEIPAVQMYQSASCQGLASPSLATRRSSFSMGLSEGDASKEFAARQKLEKQIAMIARNAAVDIHMEQLLEVNFSSRRINQGEKDMLTKALNLEKEGDFDSAIVCYKRAGVHSKDKQLSQMLMGNLYMRQKKFLVALSHYNLALKILLDKAIRQFQDEFQVYFNRAILYFRLGNDENGLRDIESALAIDSNNVNARALLGLTHRRTGQYNQAIEEALHLRNQRLEEERRQKLQNEQLQLQKAQTLTNLQEEASHEINAAQASLRTRSPHRFRSPQAIMTGNNTTGANNTRVDMSVLSAGTNSVTNLSPTNFFVAHNSISSPERVFNPVFGGTQLLIDAPNARSSLREKVFFARKSDRADENDATGGGALRNFKINNGYELELHDNLFKKPSDLQYALLTPPSHRQQAQHNIICNTLKMFPFLRNLSASATEELAGCVEYRALSGKEELFLQNEESGVACFLLHGLVQVRMDASVSSTMMQVSLGEKTDFSSFGHVDLLFRHPRPELTSALEEVLFSHYLKQQSKHASSIANVGNQTNEFGGNFKMNPTVTMEDDLRSELSSHAEIEDERLSKFHATLRTMWDKSIAITHRAVNPLMFKSYTMQSACEFLMVAERDFNRILLAVAIDELKERIRAIVSCGIFRDWEIDDIVRLARMGHVKLFKRGEVILEQGVKPQSLGIVLKGLCKVIKRPNRTEMLYQKLQIALEKADRHDLQYVFHHGVSKGAAKEENTHRRTLSPHQRKTGPRSTDGLSPTTPSHGLNRSKSAKLKNKQRQDPIEQLRAVSTTITQEHSQPTEAEIVRKELQDEIDKLQQLIHKAQAQDAMDRRDNRSGPGGTLSPSRLVSSSNGAIAHKREYDLVCSDNAGKVNELAGYLSGKISEIATLQWPMLFGEACVLDPENGISRGSVVADTSCQIFMLHKVQIQTFSVDADFLDRVRGKAIHYPGDPQLIVNMYRGIEWKHYKEEMMSGVPKNRWPKKLDSLEPFSV